MEMLLFMIFAAVAVGAALAMVFSRNAVHSALFLLLNFCMLAALYVLLNAQFIAMAQIVVYAGAIVVLVLFVIMLLGAELGETNELRAQATTHQLVFRLRIVIGTMVGVRPIIRTNGNRLDDLFAVNPGNSSRS